MMQIVPKWRVQWKIVGVDKIGVMNVHANHYNEVSKWVNMISFDKLEIEEIVITKLNENNQEGILQK